MTSALGPGSFLAEKYRVERVLGQGGMGIVVAATHLQLQQQVAIKVLLPEMARDKKVVARFLQEGRSQVRIQGEHVVRVLDVGTQQDGAPFMVMELLAGSDLGAVADARGALPVQEAIDYVLQAAEALAQAHSLGIVHRDLKPQNMFLTTRPDGSPLVKVLDFGISKNEIMSNATRRAASTTQGGILGSPAYMSPEQIRNPKAATSRSDIWSLGVILYELLTGCMPFNANDLVGILAAITRDPPDDIRRHRSDIPDPVAAVVMRCLSRHPDDRPQDVAEFAFALAMDARGHERAMRIAQIVRRFSTKPPELAQTVFAKTMLAGDATVVGGSPAISARGARSSTLEGASTALELDVDLPMSRMPRKWLAFAMGAGALAVAAVAVNVAMARVGHMAAATTQAHEAAPAASSVLAPAVPPPAPPPAAAPAVPALAASPAPVASSAPAPLRGRSRDVAHPPAMARRDAPSFAAAAPPPAAAAAPAPALAPAPARDVLDTRK